MRKKVLTLTVLLALALPIAVHAGGPAYVAGSGFNSGAAGTPLTWAGGQISYYTDQGDLSTLLRQSDADSFVAAAFSLWTSVPTAALAATRAGQLDENVSGANVTRSGAVLTMPADIQPTSAKPFAIVYDSDGRVIDALLGTGASAGQNCATNAVVGGPDRLTADACSRPSASACRITTCRRIPFPAWRFASTFAIRAAAPCSRRAKSSPGIVRSRSRFPVPT